MSDFAAGFPAHDPANCAECAARVEALKPKRMSGCSCVTQMPYTAVRESVRCVSCGSHLKDALTSA